MFEFMREGHFARHLRRMRPLYAERRRILVAALEREFGQNAEIMGDAAGMHLALLLKRAGNDQAIAARAAKQSLWLSPLSASCRSSRITISPSLACPSFSRVESIHFFSSAFLVGRSFW